MRNKFLFWNSLILILSTGSSKKNKVISFPILAGSPEEPRKQILKINANADIYQAKTENIYISILIPIIIINPLKHIFCNI